MVRKIFHRYKLFLINVTSASSLLALSDLSVQIFYEKRKPIDKPRFYGALFTGMVMGLEGHVWYTFLDRVISQVTWRQVSKKVLLDQVFAAPIYTVTYIAGTSILEGRQSPIQLKVDMQENFLTMYTADCLIFSPIQFFNFKYIPSYYRVVFLSVVTLLFDGFISAYKHKQNNFLKTEE